MLIASSGAIQVWHKGDVGMEMFIASSGAVQVWHKGDVGMEMFIVSWSCSGKARKFNNGDLYKEIPT